MGKTYDYVPIQLTKAFREAQSDERFQGWLKMQEASMEIEFPIYDLPEIRDSMYTKESLETVEATLMELYPNESAAYAGDENLHRTMRYVYYIGETFRRAFEGTWVALPPSDPKRDVKLLRPAIDLPFRELFVQPMELIGMALNRRSGIEITRVYGHIQRAYSKWLDAGRPEREFRGTLREQS
ncbi:MULTISPECIES: hypothetical protein [Mycobacterium]|uniref:hypothetical protein n=1 Tax=Mycobacterium TaxID=1763 RepID=UPI0007A0AE91|nr:MULTISPECIES: hypothetical protein [Mycobacterium]MCV7100895.1 hypothetical protein [Mycobacterium palustre]MDV3219689.1 hypothetical protein [Mycobacterium avium]